MYIFTNLKPRWGVELGKKVRRCRRGLNPPDTWITKHQTPNTMQEGGGSGGGRWCRRCPYKNKPETRILKPERASTMQEGGGTGGNAQVRVGEHAWAELVLSASMQVRPRISSRNAYTR